MNGIRFKVGLGLLAAFVLSTSAAAQQVEMVISGLEFTTNIAMDAIETDVLVEKNAGSGEVFRTVPEAAERYRNAPAYAAVEALSAGPWALDLVGPYPKGKPLGFTLGEWLKAYGTATYACRSGVGHVKAKFENLVPNGVYTMWYSLLLKLQLGCADCAFAGLDMPLGHPSGSQNTFVSDDAGNGDFEAYFTPCLGLGNEQITAVLALAYHSDGKTYGARPVPAEGGFGLVTHVHIVAALPDEGAWTANPCSAQ